MLMRNTEIPQDLPAESSPGYPTAIKLNERVRVIVCPLTIQWIVQTLDGPQTTRGDPETAPTARWRSRSFCRTKDGLIRCSQRLAGGLIDPAVAVRLAALPDFIDGTAAASSLKPAKEAISTRHADQFHGSGRARPLISGAR